MHISWDILYTYIFSEPHLLFNIDVVGSVETNAQHSIWNRLKLRNWSTMNFEYITFCSWQHVLENMHCVLVGGNRCSTFIFLLIGWSIIFAGPYIKFLILVITSQSPMKQMRSIALYTPFANTVSVSHTALTCFFVMIYICARKLGLNPFGNVVSPEMPIGPNFQ